MQVEGRLLSLLQHRRRQQRTTPKPSTDIIELGRQIARGYPNPTNYQLRMLLITAGLDTSPTPNSEEPDTAMAESLWATLTTEYYYRRAFTTCDQVYAGVAAWIEFDHYARPYPSASRPRQHELPA